VQPSGAQVRVNAQLIEAGSGAHVWAEQFDTLRADLLQTQDEIVTHLARALELQLPEAEAARLKRAPAANPDAEDLALQCLATTILKHILFGKEADAGYRLCEQALDADPNNVLALTTLSVKFYSAAGFGHSADPNADFNRADELLSRALAIDPNYPWAHTAKATLTYFRGRAGEAIPEAERALALNPAEVGAVANLGWDYSVREEYEKSTEYFDKAIRLSPRDPDLDEWYSGKALNYFALKQYDQSVEWCRRANAINPKNNPFTHTRLIAALALSGHDAEAREALQLYLALPSGGPRTIAGWKALVAQFIPEPRTHQVADSLDRFYVGLRKAGMPEE
jgi:adenylate cyclase